MPRLITERHSENSEIIFTSKYRKDLNNASKKELYFHANKEKLATESRQFYAAAKIQSLIRGVLTRFAYAELRERDKAVRLIQRIVRGKLGRVRWMREYWRSLSVVKSEPALVELLKRSSELRISEKVQGTGHIWKEYYDPMTRCIWYLNCKTRFNTWICPPVFQFDLVCKWNGYGEFGAQPSKGKLKCRMVFKTISAYQQHMKDAHKWYCTACDYHNSGLNFPVCSMCSNTRGASGEDGEEVLKEDVSKVRNKLQMFISKDKKNDKGYQYDLRERLIDSGIEELKLIKKQEEELKKLELGQGDEKNKSNSNALVTKTDSDIRELPAINKSKSKSKNIYSNDFDEEMEGNAFPNFVATAGGPENAAIVKKKGEIVLPGCTTPIVPCFDTPDDFIESIIKVKDSTVGNSRFSYDPKYSSVSSKTHFKLMKENEEYHNRLESQSLDFSFSGNIPPELFNEICDLKTSFYDDDDIDSTASSEQTSLTSYGTLESILGASKMLICSQFLSKRCKRINCPRAHPGLRDEAEIHYCRVPGKAKKVPYVHICSRYNGSHTSCLDGNVCRNYHIYIRPSTQEIIRKLYPIEKGEKEKVFASGCRLEGEVKNGQFEGYGIMTYNDGSCYMGDWVNNRREGFGIYRSVKGTEYAGQWKAGTRHGKGVFLSESGEEYHGDWVEGRMEGVGQLTALNGDMYEGHFVSNKFNGLGIFTKKNGDQYMGYFKDGMANGLGVLALSTGEKYKGYFDRNARHGKGVCAYRNGSRYAGEWYRGVPEGFGVYLSPQGEKYIGQWSSGKKHGKGRYYFLNLDFYDGEFVKNSAKGMGVYYHSNGNIYSGEWDKDKRNGRGTYIFANGSKYTGYWLNNDMNGKGKFDFANGNYFRGSLLKNKKHGKGEFTWYNGNVYRGDFFDDKMKGEGEMKYFVGHRYVGQWDNNKKNGKGTFFYSLGHIYDGDWLDDMRHGKGFMKFLANSIAEESYQGDWLNDEIHGYGKYIYRFDDGVTYEGQWQRGRRAGKGTISYKDGSYYRGDFYKEQMWGRGVYVDSANGYQYDGDWRMNMRQGFGTEMISDGSIYYGEFWANMRHGSGKVTYADGSSFEGRWEGNIILGEGKRTILVGEGPSKSGPTEIVVKVFSY
jgi:hypothetical protein